MQIIKLNTYKILHKNRKTELINASSIYECLETMEDKESPVIKIFMEKEGVSTVQEELPALIPFTSVIEDGLGGNIATPSSGSIHVGDTVSFEAVPLPNYEFVSWSRNGKVISDSASFTYTMTPLEEGEESAVFTAKFKLSPLSWTSAVSPSGATGAGCVAFPSSGSGEAGSEVQLIAVEEGGFTFTHWERNGENIGTNKILTAELTPPVSGETGIVYTAVFTEE